MRVTASGEATGTAAVIWRAPSERIERTAASMVAPVARPSSTMMT
jgi:hypothetical protein